VLGGGGDDGDDDDDDGDDNDADATRKRDATNSPKTKKKLSDPRQPKPWRSR
jgi:hypothetical protein